MLFKCKINLITKCLYVNQCRFSFLNGIASWITINFNSEFTTIKIDRKRIVRKNNASVLDYCANIVSVIGKCYLECKTRKFKNTCKSFGKRLDLSQKLGLTAQAYTNRPDTKIEFDF